MPPATPKPGVSLSLNPGLIPATALRLLALNHGLFHAIAQPRAIPRNRSTTGYSTQSLNRELIPHIISLTSTIYLSMSHTLTKLYVHLVWHIKTTAPKIRPTDEQALYKNITVSLQELDCQTITINGTDNHVHILFTLSKNYSLSDVVARAKRVSSYWLKAHNPYYQTFSWQKGYGAFSVSPSHVEAVISYIANQKEHHKKVSFEDEYKRLLQRYGITYDDNYVFTDD